MSDELRLPIEFGPASNGEYDPRPLSEVAREAIRRARIDCLATADRLAMPRRRFLRSLCAASVVLLSL
ncbi:MAG TPA: amidohydrolase, partial [Actinomycetota bacterium]|nr:amidohydrolase [Actinomycetota bacterium]